MCLRLRDETRKGCGAAAASGEVGGSQRVGQASDHQVWGASDDEGSEDSGCHCRKAQHS